jgi:membrane protein
MISKEQLKKILQNLYFSERRFQNSRLRKTAVYLVRYIFHITREILSDQCLLRSAALTFTTLMTLIPIAVLLFVFMSTFGVLDDVRTRVQAFLFQHLLPESVAAVQGYIERLLANFNVQAASYISIIVLIGATYSLFSSVNSSLNTIWGGRRSGKFFTKLIHIWFLVTLAPLFLGYSLYLTTQLETITTLGAGVFLTGLLTRVMPYILTFLTLTLLYKFVPQPKVQWRSAFLGALFAALLWEFSKYAFNYYVSNLANYQLIYGSFLTLPVFLIWINLTWFIILLGAEIAYTHQNLDHLHLISKRRAYAKQNMFLLSEKLGMLLFFSIIEHYMEGKPISQKELAAHAPGSGWMVDTFLERFQRDGFVIINDDGLIVPARDPSTIQLNDVLDFFEPDKSYYISEDSSDSYHTVKKLFDDLKTLRTQSFVNKDTREMVNRMKNRNPVMDGEI